MKKIKILNRVFRNPLTCLTAYSSKVANLLDGKVDFILIGDSLGTTLYGMKNTQGVTMDMMKLHGLAVTKEVKKSMTIIDMPFRTYNNKFLAYRNAKSLIKYTNANFVKLEINKSKISIIKYLTDKGINVIAHIGVTPQKYKNFKKIKVKGRSNKEISSLVQLAVSAEKAGAKLILLECITETAAKKIIKTIGVPSIGIGASKYCSGQVLVFDDIIDLVPIKNNTKFIKKFANSQTLYKLAINKFVRDVKNGKFPSKKHTYT